MIIANPIYDSIFKRILENDAAKFFVSTILGCNVLSLEPSAINRPRLRKTLARTLPPP